MPAAVVGLEVDSGVGKMLVEVVFRFLSWEKKYSKINFCSTTTILGIWQGVIDQRWLLMSLKCWSWYVFVSTIWVLGNFNNQWKHSSWRTFYLKRFRQACVCVCGRYKLHLALVKHNSFHKVFLFCLNLRFCRVVKTVSYLGQCVLCDGLKGLLDIDGFFRRSLKVRDVVLTVTPLLGAFCRNLKRGRKLEIQKTLTSTLCNHQIWWFQIPFMDEFTTSCNYARNGSYWTLVVTNVNTLIFQ